MRQIFLLVKVRMHMLGIYFLSLQPFLCILLLKLLEWAGENIEINKITGEL